MELKTLETRIMIYLCESMSKDTVRALHDILVKLFDPDEDPEIAYRQLSDMLIILAELMP